MLVIGFGYTLFAGKTKEQRASSTQIKLLRKAVQETMLAKGVGADRVAEYMKDYWKLTNSLDYDADIQQRFSTLCQVAGVAGDGAFVDQRLL